MVINNTLEQDIANNEKILEKSNPKPKNKFLLFSAIGILAVATAFTAIHVNNNLNTTSKNKDLTSTINSSKVTSIFSKSIISPIYGEGISSELKERLENVGNFEIDSSLASNQISRKVSQIKFEDKDYLPSLISEAEGFRKNTYNDNIGFALGNGWNISMQNKEYNTKISKLISQDSLFISNVAALSGKISSQPITGEFSKITITPQQSIQVATFMSDTFKNEGVLPHLEKFVKKHPKAQAIHNKTGEDYSKITSNFFNSLELNEQAAIVYHSYKVGASGFGKYKTLLTNLVDYGYKDNKTLADKTKVAENFEYKYQMNGEQKIDIRAATIISSMFISYKIFGQIIEKGVAPKAERQAVPQFEKYKIDISSDNISIPDPVGDFRKNIEANGGKIDIQLKEPLPENKSLYNVGLTYLLKPK